MQINTNKNSIAADTNVKKPESNSNTRFRIPMWAGLALLVIVSGYAGIKQYISDLPRAVADSAQKSEDTFTKPSPAAEGSATDSSVQRYAKQLADRNKVVILGEPHYDLEHHMRLAFYSTSDGSTIMCSLKRVECFFNQKKTDLQKSQEFPSNSQ